MSPASGSEAIEAGPTLPCPRTSRVCPRSSRVCNQEGVKCPRTSHVSARFPQFCSLLLTLKGPSPFLSYYFVFLINALVIASRIFRAAAATAGVHPERRCRN